MSEETTRTPVSSTEPKKVGRPAKVAETTELEELKRQLAEAQAALSELNTAKPVKNTVADEPVTMIHFIEDGFTLGNVIYYRGQELEVDPKKDTWAKSDERDQIKSYGRVIYRPGPWQGLTFEEEIAARSKHEDENMRLTAEEIETLRRISEGKTEVMSKATAEPVAPVLR